MNELTYRKLNPTEAIIAAMPRLIDAFVTFYGEEERERITRKFNEILVLGYMKPQHITTIIREDLKQKSQELIEEFLDELNVGSEREEFRKVVFDKYLLEYTNLHPISQYIRYREGNIYNKQEVVALIRKIEPGVTEEKLDEFIINGKLAKLDSFVDAYKRLLEKYNSYKEIFKPYQEYVLKCERLKDKLEKQYMMLLVNEISDLFNEEELQEIEGNYYSNYGKMIKDVNGKTKCYFGGQLGSVALIDAFSSESEQLLVDGSDWRRNSIIEDRMKYFKNMGINLGDNYLDYVNHEDVRQLFPKLKELAERIIVKRGELYTLMMNEYYQSLEQYKQDIKRIEKVGLVNKVYEYNANAYEVDGTFISANIKMVDNEYMLVPMLCYSMGNLEEYLDQVLVHELNHVYELSLQRVDKNVFYHLCGWDSLKGELETEIQSVVSLEENTVKREYELFNEIINELIAQEISKILFDSGGYVFNTKENAKIRGGTNYENSMFLVKTFYETYRKEIIESRKSGDMTKLFDIVGKDNFEALNQLFHEFYENFSGMA